MGTTLTGTTPQDTYDSLIKVTDNGPLSGTAKYLSDGLGNDSALALSTSRVGVGNTAPAYKLDVTGDIRTNVASGNGSLYINNSSLTSKFWTFIPETAAGETNLLFFYGGTGAGTKMTLTNGGNVGIGTSSPATALEVRGTSPQFRVGISAGGYVEISDNQVAAKTSAAAAADLYLNVSGANTILNRDSGNVGIGTSAPSDKLHVSGSGNTATFITGSGCTTYIQSVTNETRIGNLTSGGGSIVFSPSDAERVRITSNGLTFNGDTAAANALDDYEEGTFTLSFGGASTAGTYTPTAVNATYTKIGRVVTLQYKATFTSGASGGSGYMEISGLPFAYAANSGGLTSSIILSDASWGGSYLSLLPVSSGSESKLLIVETAPSTGLTNFVQAGDFNTSTDIRFTLTYQV